MELGARLVGIVCRFGVGHGGGTRRLQHWERDVGIHRIAGDPLRCQRAASHVWAREPARRHGPFLDHGQVGTAVPQCRGLCAGAPCHTRRRRQGPDGARRTLQLGSVDQAGPVAYRLLEERVRTRAAGRAAGLPRGRPPGSRCASRPRCGADSVLTTGRPSDKRHAHHSHGRSRGCVQRTHHERPG